VLHKVPGLLNGIYGSSRWMASLKNIPRAIPGQPMFGSRRKKAEMSRQYIEDRYVVRTNRQAEARLSKRRSANADSSLTTPKPKNVWGPVRSE
jgi:hypothetical protein